MGEVEFLIAGLGFLLVAMTFVLGRVSSLVVLITSSGDTYPFPDTEAVFGPRVPSGGVSGQLYVANPLNACEPLLNGPHFLKDSSLPILLISRGACPFTTKIQHAQDAGYSAAVVFDNVFSPTILTMSGNSGGIQIPAVFVSKSAGNALLNYSLQSGTRCYILPTIENISWTIMAISFLALVIVISVLGMLVFVRRRGFERLHTWLLFNSQWLGISPREVKSLPRVVFKSVRDKPSPAESCAICLEEYHEGEKLRILPCRHDFHSDCIDKWLFSHRSFCPICKRDAFIQVSELPPTERTPLISANASSAPSRGVTRDPSLAASPSLPARVSSIISLNASGTSLQHVPSASSLRALFTSSDRAQDLC